MYNLEAVFTLFGAKLREAGNNATEVFDQAMVFSVRVWMKAILGHVPPRDPQVAKRTRETFIQTVSSQ